MCKQIEDIKMSFLHKLVKSYATLKIVRIEYAWSYKKKFYPIKKGSTINEIKEVFSKYLQPYNWVEMDKFLEGQTKSLTIDTGAFKWQISV